MAIKFYSNTELRFNYYKAEGILSPNDISDFLFENKMNPSYKSDHNILVDITDAKFINMWDELEQFAQYVRNDSDNWTTFRKCAILTSSPVDSVNAQLLKYKVDKLQPRLVIKIFSTEDAAYNWLSIY